MQKDKTETQLSARDVELLNRTLAGELTPLEWLTGIIVNRITDNIAADADSIPTDKPTDN